MLHFSSPRERRLWIWTLAVIAAIYASLALANALSGVLGNQAIAAALFLLGMVLVGLTVATQGLSRRPGVAELTIAVGVLAVLFMLALRTTLVTERSHVIEYSVLAVFIYEALAERRKQGRHVPVPGLLAIIASSLVGVVDECIQLFIPSRIFDPEDMLFNFLAAAAAVTASLLLAWIQKKIGRKRETIRR